MPAAFLQLIIRQKATCSLKQKVAFWMYMFIRSFEELTAVTVQILVFWFIRPCRLVGSY